MKCAAEKSRAMRKAVIAASVMMLGFQTHVAMADSLVFVGDPTGYLQPPAGYPNSQIGFTTGQQGSFADAQAWEDLNTNYYPGGGVFGPAPRATDGLSIVGVPPNYDTHYPVNSPYNGATPAEDSGNGFTITGAGGTVASMDVTGPGSMALTGLTVTGSTYFSSIGGIAYFSPSSNTVTAYAPSALTITGSTLTTSILQLQSGTSTYDYNQGVGPDPVADAGSFTISGASLSGTLTQIYGDRQGGISQLNGIYPNIATPVSLTNGASLKAGTEMDIVGVDSSVNADCTGTTTLAASGSTISAGVLLIATGTTGFGSGTAANDATVNLSAGSTLTCTTAGYLPSSLVVADTGMGRLSVTGASTVNTNQSVVGNQADAVGAVTLDASTWNNASFLTIGYNGSGSVTVQHNAKIITNDVLYVGLYDGSYGSLAITNGGTVTTNTTGIDGTNSTDVGTENGSTGVITIDGAGSKLVNNGDVGIGYDGTGTVTLTNGGSLVVNGPIIRVGRNDDGTGTLTVTGTGSNVTGTAAALYVGYGGNGTVYVQSSASITIASTDIGGVTTGIGALSIDGTGTQSTLGTTIVGDAGNGSLGISNGAAVNTGDLTIGSQETGSGDLVVSGSSGTLTINGELKIGDQGQGGAQLLGTVNVTADTLTIGASSTGNGSLDLDSGATFTTTGDATLGDVAGSGGDLYIGGTSATQVTVGGKLSIGNGGYGYATVGAGSTLTVQGESATIGEESTGYGILIQSGQFTTESLAIGGSMEQAGGNGTLTALSGSSTNINSTLQIWANGTLDASGGGSVTIGSGTAAASNTIRIYGNGTLTSTGTLNAINIINAGTFSQTGTLNESGNFTNSGTATLGGLQNWSHGAVFTNTAGTATIQTDAGSPGSQNLSFNVTGGTVTLASTQHLAGLSIGTNGTVQVTGGGSGDRSVIVTPSLSVTGTLDLTTNALDIQGGSLSALTTLVAKGYHNGTWTGTGITSTTAASVSKHLAALGIMVNNQSGSPIYTASVPFDGVTPGASDILVKYTYYGDTNLDGKVDGSDYSRIDAAYQVDKSNATALTGWFNGDFNYDNIINGSDYTLIDNTFNQQGASLASAIADPLASPTLQVAGTSAVPEPPTLAILMMIAPLLLGRLRASRFPTAASFQRLYLRRPKLKNRPEIKLAKNN